MSLQPRPRANGLSTIKTFNIFGKIPSISFYQYDNEGRLLLERATRRLYRTVSSAFRRTQYSGMLDTPQDPGFDAYGKSSDTLLFGHNFARTTPSLVYPLDPHFFDDRTPWYELYGGTTLSADNVASLPDGTGALSGYSVALLNGSSSRLYTQYAANASLLPDDTTTSFLMGGWFLSHDLSGTETVFHYGAATGARVGIEFVDDKLVATLNDGTNTITIEADAAPLKDLQWHYAGILVDRNTDTAKLIVTDGTFQTRYSLSADTSGLGSLGAVGGLYLSMGAKRSGTDWINHFDGSLSNFQFYNFTGEIDHATVQLVLAGIREGAAKDVTMTATNHAAQRLNGTFNVAGDAGAYTYALVNTFEGRHTFQFLVNYSSDQSAYKVFIDGIDWGGFDHYNATDINNRNLLIDDVELASGWHFVKILLQDSANPNAAGNDLVRIGGVKLFKTEGPQEGSSHHLLLGGELRERSHPMLIAGVNSSPFGNHVYHDLTETVPDGATMSGNIFAEAGLYRLTAFFGRRDDGAIVDVLVNGQRAVQIDTYESAANVAPSADAFVRLQDGLNRIEIRGNGKHADSAGHRFTFIALTIDAEAQTKQGDHVQIFHDTGIVPKTGDVHLLYSPQYRYGHAIFGVDANNRWIRRKRFKGGMYRLHLDFFRILTGGNSELLIDGDSIATFSNYELATHTNHSLERLINLDEGEHDIEVRSTGAGGSNLHDTIIDGIFFDLIGTGPFVERETRIDSSKKIAEWVAHRSNMDDILIPIARLEPGTFSTLRVRFALRASGTTGTFMRVNEIDATQYYIAGLFQRFGQATEIIGGLGNALQAFWGPELGTNDVARADITINLDTLGAKTYPAGKIDTSTEDGSARAVGWVLRQSVQGIDSLEFIFTGPGLSEGSKIEVFAE